MAPIWGICSFEAPLSHNLEESRLVLHRMARAMEVPCVMEGQGSVPHLELETPRYHLGLGIYSPHGDAQLVDNRGDGLVLALYGRLDNRQDLINRLAPREDGLEDLQGLSDAELLVKLYRKWGRGFVRHLTGDLLVVVFDLEHLTLFCATDKVGLYPLYYAERGGTLFFASRIRAILATGHVDSAPNHRYIARFLLMSPGKGSQTGFRHIYKLSPGKYLLFRRSGLRIRRYHSFMDVKEVRFKEDIEYILGFRERFLEAITLRTRGKDHTGSALSGGLDSSSICSIIAKFLTCKRLSSFSAIFPSLPPGLLALIDERRYQEEVLRAYPDIEPHRVMCDLSSPFRHIGSMITQLDDLYFAPNLYIHWEIYKRAKETDIDIFLDGIDGDTAVSHGYERLPELLLSGRFASLFMELYKIKKKDNLSLTRMAGLTWSLVLSPVLPVSINDRIRGLLCKRDGRQALVRRRLLRQLSMTNLISSSSRDVRFSGARTFHAQALASSTISYVVEILYHTSTFFDLAVGYPFLDVQLLEYCIGLPASQKLKGGWTRYVLREAMEGILPEKVRRRRTKANLAPNFMYTLWRHDRGFVLKELKESEELLSDYISPERLRQLQGSFSRLTNVSTKDLDLFLQVYMSVMLALWLRHHFF